MARDRIVEIRTVKGRDLTPNPANWRRHPEAQRDAMAAVLDDVGNIDVLKAVETSAGLLLIDGHLRAGLMPDDDVQVAVLDLDETEQAKVLATFDPIGAMAQVDAESFAAIAEAATFENERVRAMLDAIASNEYAPLTIPGPESENPPAYTQTVDTPIYEPSGPQPEVAELSDRSTADELRREIRDAELPEEVEGFLLDAAERHVAFNFQRIANYYAHAPADVQALMERSALVVIDYDQAIERGFVRLKEDIDAAFHEDYPDA